MNPEFFFFCWIRKMLTREFYFRIAIYIEYSTFGMKFLFFVGAIGVLGI